MLSSSQLARSFLFCFSFIFYQKSSVSIILIFLLSFDSCSLYLLCFDLFYFFFSFLSSVKIRMIRSFYSFSLLLFFFLLISLPLIVKRRMSFSHFIPSLLSLLFTINNKKMCVFVTLTHTSHMPPPPST